MQSNLCNHTDQTGEQEDNAMTLGILFGSFGVLVLLFCGASLLVILYCKQKKLKHRLNRNNTSEY